MSLIRIALPSAVGAVAAFSAAALAVGENVHRPARLFIAGDYPDKGCTVTEADLDLIVSRFNDSGAEVPVKCEHIDTPLDPLGQVIGLYRRGPELFGMLAFSSGINAHVEARGVQDLSVSLVREAEADGGGYRLAETSLVFKGRVPGAGFLSPEQVSAKFSELRTSGRITPAMMPHVERLLSVPLPVQFSDGSPSVDVAAETLAMLAAAPVSLPRRLAAPAVFSNDRRESNAIPEATHSMAKAFGISPDKLHAEVKKGAGA